MTLLNTRLVTCIRLLRLETDPTLETLERRWHVSFCARPARSAARDDVAVLYATNSCPITSPAGDVSRHMKAQCRATARSAARADRRPRPRHARQRRSPIIGARDLRRASGPRPSGTPLHPMGISPRGRLVLTRSRPTILGAQNDPFLVSAVLDRTRRWLECRKPVSGRHPTKGDAGSSCWTVGRRRR